MIDFADHAANLKAASELLEYFGYTVVEAAFWLEVGESSKPQVSLVAVYDPERPEDVL